MRSSAVTHSGGTFSGISTRSLSKCLDQAAVKLITEKGRSVAEVAKSLGTAPKLLGRWKTALEAVDASAAFPGHGHLPPAEDELRRLKAEVARLKAERDILKKAATYFAKLSG